MTQVIEKQRIDLGVLPTKGVDYWTEEDIAHIDAATRAANAKAEEARQAAEDARQEAEDAHEAAGKVAANMEENTKKTEENIKENTAKTDSAIEALANMKRDVDEAIELAKNEAKHADDSAVNADRAAADANREMITFSRNESDRQANEASRVSAETARSNQENDRIYNEQTRQAQETARQGAEANRTTIFNQTQEARQQTFEASEEDRTTDFENSQTDRETAFNAKEAERDEAVRVATAITPRVVALESGKANKDGHYDSLGAGSADRLNGNETPTEQSFVYRKAGGDTEIMDGTAQYTEVVGKSVVANQLFNPTTWNNADFSVSFVGNTMTLTCVNPSYITTTRPFVTPFTFVNGHSYLIGTTKAVPSGLTFAFMSGSSQIGMLNNDVNMGIVTANVSGDAALKYNINMSVAGESYTSTFYVIDLTQWYTGNVPEGLTAEKFLADYPWVLSMGYNAGEIINNTTEAIKTKDSDGNVIGEISVKPHYIEGGLKSAGSVYDSKFADKEVQRVLGLELNGTEDWSLDTSSRFVLVVNQPASVNVQSGQNALSNSYNLFPVLELTSNADSFGYATTGNRLMFFDIAKYPTLQSWKQHLSDLKAAGTPLTVYYELATPIVHTYEQADNTSAVVKANGTEEAIASTDSTPCRVMARYSLDVYEQVKKDKDSVTSVKEKVNTIETDMGKYQQLPDVTLTIVESGKRIDKNGKFVADSNWNVGRLGAISKGNIYELFMGGSDKMVLGTALFVSHTIERIAGVDTDVYTPIYSAATSDLPISNYAVLLAGEGYADVLVSYRNDVSGANVMKVARWGIFASLATQYSNLKEAVDLKSFADGYYKNMRVGNADTLTIGSTAPTYDEQLGGRQVNNAPEMMGTRDATSTNSTSNISVREMRGGVIGGNQMVDLGNSYQSNGITYTSVNACTQSAKGTASRISFGLGSRFNVTTGRKYLKLVNGVEDSNAQVQYFYTTPTGGGNSLDLGNNIVTMPDSRDKAIDVRIRITSGATVDVEYTSVFIDLTHLFPTDPSFVNSLTASDAIKVANKLSFFAYDRTASNAVTHNESATLAKMAEVVAKLGYQPTPQLWFGSVGRINLVDGNTGRIKQSIDMIATKTKAWNKALAVLRERGIDIPTFLEKPTEFGVNDDVCVKWTNDQLEVNCWVVDLGSLSWRIFNINYEHVFTTENIPGSKAYQNMQLANALMLGYTTKMRSEMVQGTIDKTVAIGTFSGEGTEGFICDYSCDTAEQFKTAMQGQYLIYQLTTPIFIPLDEPMNINFVDAKPYDLYTLDDMDGEPMYEVEVNPNADGTYHTVVAPKAEWVDAHKQLPVTIGATLAGIGTNVGYDFIMALEQRVRNLENR